MARAPAATVDARDTLSRIGSLLVALASLLAVLLVAIRPWYMTWGATEAELQSRLPGDELGFSDRNETRAIAIAARADQVFAWVAQLGQDRAGFYSYELLEDLAGCNMPRLERLDPELQRWSVGDKLWMYPPDELGGMGHARLLAYEPGHALVFGTRVPTDAPQAAPSGTWSFVVQATGERSSRLIVRGTGGPTPSLLGSAFNRTVFEPLHFAMERRMLEGIRDLAEGRTPPTRLYDGAVLASWTVTFVLFVASAAAVLLAARWRRQLAHVVGAGVVFQVLTLLQPPLPIGVLCTLSLLLLVRPRSTAAKHRSAEPEQESTRALSTSTGSAVAAPEGQDAAPGGADVLDEPGNASDAVEAASAELGAR
jgi:hypothetical protein